MGILDADSAEHGGSSKNLLIAPVACPVPNGTDGSPKLSGRRAIRIKPGCRLAAIYRTSDIEEEYFCNYEVRPDYRATLEASDARVTGIGPDDEVRVVELPDQRFWIATLYQPQRSSKPGAPNPLVRAFVAAAEEFASERAARGAWP